MSWFSSNYEKALLGGGVVIALGAAYLGWSRFSSVDADFGNTLNGGGSNQSAVAGAELVDAAIASMTRDRAWTQERDESGRPVDLFVGIPLYVERGKTDRAIDLLKGREVHEGIPNSFWLENHLDPGYADSPERDPDDDGFNNREEFLAKTDPQDERSHPQLISKLRFVREESLAWLLRPGFLEDGGSVPMKYRDGLRRENAAPAGGAVAPGQLFFDEEPMKARFKLVGHETRKVMNQAINIEEEITFIKIEDQRPNKLGTVYEIPAPLNRRDEAKYTQFDRSAVFRLEALGKDGQEFVIEENTRFALPDGAKNKDYLLKEVSADSITIEYRGADGNESILKIAKGRLPDQ